MTELVDDDVVEHLGRGEHETPVEGDRPAWRARAPERPLVGDPNAPERDADPRCLFLGDPGDELARGCTCIGLADRERTEPEPRNVPAPLRRDPVALRL